jgi:hypothetical protein
MRRTILVARQTLAIFQLLPTPHSSGELTFLFAAYFGVNGCRFNSKRGRAKRVLSAVGHNFRRIIAWLRELLCLFLVQLSRMLARPAPDQFGFLTDDDLWADAQTTKSGRSAASSSPSAGRCD